MIVGIDLGTTNSLVAIWEENESKLIPNAQGNYLTPSIVSLDATGNVVVGNSAVDQMDAHQQLSLASFKRYMGTNKILHIFDVKGEMRAEVARVIQDFNRILDTQELHTIAQARERVIDFVASFKSVFVE
jgi:molecular chaperone DnaK (HSP70)